MSHQETAKYSILATTCWKRGQHVQLQHARTDDIKSGYNMTRTGGMFLLQCQQSLKIFCAVADIAQHFLTPLLTALTIFIAITEKG
jgi:hypothetical protein